MKVSDFNEILVVCLRRLVGSASSYRRNLQGRLQFTRFLYSSYRGVHLRCSTCRRISFDNVWVNSEMFRLSVIPTRSSYVTRLPLFLLVRFSGGFLSEEQQIKVIDNMWAFRFVYTKRSIGNFSRRMPGPKLLSRWIAEFSSKMFFSSFSFLRHAAGTSRLNLKLFLYFCFCCFCRTKREKAERSVEYSKTISESEYIIWHTSLDDIQSSSVCGRVNQSSSEPTRVACRLK